MAATVEDLADLIRLLEEHPDWQEALARVVLTPKTLMRIFQSDPELQAVLRAVILGEEFLQLPALTRQLIERVGGLEEVSRESVQRISALEEVSRESVQRIGALEEVSRESVQRLTAVEQDMAELKETSQQSVARLDETVGRLDETVNRLNETIVRLDRIEGRQRGMEGRLAGEDYEKRVRRSAWRLFFGGEGGNPDDERVQRRLREWLGANRALVGRIREEDDPSLTDLIWWKGERVAVVEVSLKVNGEDVQRAHARARTLREAGVDAFPLVIGEEWAHPESRALAEQLQVAWKVDDDVSQDYIEFRRIEAD